MSKSSVTDLVSGMRDMRWATRPAFVIAIISIAVFAFLSYQVGGDGLAGFDSQILLFFRDPQNLADPMGPEWLEKAILEITTLGGYPVLITLVTAVVGFLVVSGQYGPAIFTVGAIVSGTMASSMLKHVIDRPRPQVVDHLVHTYTASFPSGHATMSAVVYLTLAVLIVRLSDRFLVRLYVLCAAIFLTFIVGMSRIYLGVHWPSDVLGGWALGVAWASQSWLAVSGLREVRSHER